MENPLLAIEDLTVVSQRGGHDLPPRELLSQLSLTLHRGQIVGLAGESGSGKSMLGNAIGGLLPIGCTVTTGRLLWRGEDLRQAPPAAWNALRGKHIAYVFQEPMTALNPTLRIGRQLVDVIRQHGAAGGSVAREQALKLLVDVRIDDAAAIFDAWPHQLSGGMRQRVLIAMAFSLRPALIVADEPTTALDVTVRAQVLALLLALARQHDTAVLLITHDIGVVRSSCDVVNVMYAGRIVERGPTAAVLAAPAHPYTRALLDCLPERALPKSTLNALPVAGKPMPGCVFRGRCSAAIARCAEPPPLQAVAGAHHAACWLNQAAR